MSGNRVQPLLKSGVYPVHLPLAADGGEKWKPHHLFKGVAKGMRELSCHVSVLSTGYSPHPPHEHMEEEILILLSGEVDLEIPDPEGQGNVRRMRLNPGRFAYYPSRFPHTLRTTSAIPANYLMFKWRADPVHRERSLGFGLYCADGRSPESEIAAGFSAKPVFDGPTEFMEKLHCHRSTLAPGAGYEPHADDYPVAVVVLEGAVETLGHRVGPYGVIFYAAGEPHGMRNPGSEYARYIVFEFHGKRAGLRGKIQSVKGPSFRNGSRFLKIFRRTFRGN